jgi:lipid II:glycine glycyltransferase (peptidoglycan interpeptide bridge formation enzyme)
VYFILRHGARYYYPWRGYEANYLRRDTIKREGEKLEEILKNKFNFFSFIKEKPLSERFSLLSGEYPAHNRIHKFIIPSFFALTESKSNRELFENMVMLLNLFIMDDFPSFALRIDEMY